MSILKRVQLTERHLNPGRTRHTLIDGNGSRAFSAFTSLEIVQFEDNPGFYLMHLLCRWDGDRHLARNGRRCSSSSGVGAGCQT